jgi:RPA family protein
MSLREPAWRMTTRELESSLEEERGSGERPAAYLVSPFGARANRVLLCGTLTPAEPVGASEPPTFWRSRLSDPLGAVAVTAGSFQPGAMAQLRSVTAPRPAIVVGKVHLYRGRDQVAYLSVRAEALRTVPEAEERALLADIVRHTLDRLDLLERIEHEPAVDDATLRRDGIPQRWIDGARRARELYTTVDRPAFRRELRAAVDHIAGRRSTPPTAPTPGTVELRRDPAPTARPTPTAAERAEESAFLDILDEASDASADGYADLRDVLERIAERGVSPARAEELLATLEESGAVEEPIVGKLRRA